MNLQKTMQRAELINLALSGHMTVKRRNELISELKDIHSQILNYRNQEIYDQMKREIFKR